ncbi:MAG: Crp/Fnr family transcriptional regulator [Candidatus Saccharimonadales bacterium]
MLADEKQLAALVDLFHTGTKHEFSKGEFVVRPGGSPNGVFYIESGLVKAYDITKYGEENLLILRRSGEMLGLTWAVTGKDRPVIYSALAPTTTWVISKEVFLDNLQNHPDIAIPIVKLLTDMYRLHGERIMTLEYRTVRERLASFLLGMSERFGVECVGGIRLEAPLRHQDIASSISATRETTSRTLSEFERKGIITTEQSHIVIKDTEALSSFIE